MFLDRPQQLRARALYPLGFGNTLRDLEARLPEPTDDRLADSADVEHVARLQWPDLPEDRPWRKRVAEGEEVVDPVLVEIEKVIRKLSKSSDLGGEGEPAPLMGEEQRLDSERIAGERQALRQLVPDGDRIHALQLEPGVVAPLEESGEDRLGVAMVGLELIAALELAAELGMIDDLSVEDDRMASVGAQKRLVTTGDVDDAEPPHPEAEVAVDEITGIVRAAVAQPVALADDSLLGHRPPAASVPPGNAAHDKLLSSRLVSKPPATDYMIESRFGNGDQKRNASRTGP